jgi:hypothetical protein
MAPNRKAKERCRPKIAVSMSGQAAVIFCGGNVRSHRTTSNAQPNKGTMLHRLPNPARSLTGRAQRATSLVVWLLAAALVPAYPAMAQNNPPAPPADQQQPPSPDKAAADDYGEAQRQINGPAGNPECVWLGRKALTRLWNDDIDTTFRDLDLYDRFGCPGAHVQAAVRCLVLHQPIPPDRKSGDKAADPKPSDTLDFRVHECWNNPTSPAIPAPAPAAATPAPAAPSAPAPNPPANH